MTIELSIVIPAYNEGATVRGVIEAHIAVATRLVGGAFEILVLDDGSTDQTAAEIVRAAVADTRVRAMTHVANEGIPATMKDLYRTASGIWTYFAPADGQVPAEALHVMWSAREGATLVVGRRRPRRDPASRILMAEVYSTVLRFAFQLRVHDIDSVKLYRSGHLRSLAIESTSNFFEAEILIKLVRGGYPVREVDIPHRPRIAGSPKGVTGASAVLAVRELAAFLWKTHSRRPCRGER